MTKIGTVPIATRYAEDLASTRACYTDVVGQEVVYRDDSEMSVRSSKPIRSFTIGVPESGLADLHERLARARWETQPAGGAEGYGVSSTWVHELAEYWKSTYDGRVWEDRLNQHPADRGW